MMLYKFSVFFLFLLLISCSNNSSSKRAKLVQHAGELEDRIVLKERSLMVFQFDTKNVKCLNKEFSIKNKDGLIFGLSGQIGVQINRGFTFTKGTDTMYLEIFGDYSHHLIRLRKFIPGYFHYQPAQVTLVPEILFGRHFITDERVLEIPLHYDDSRGGGIIRNIGETDFSVTEVSYTKELFRIQPILLDGIKEEVRKL